MLKQNQNGRSMIEMLGVLAIIGVLSIGGIAGYSKAMNKYRVNRAADQISQLAQNIRTLYASQKNYSTLSYEVIKKAHLAPEEMYEGTGTNNNSLTNPFGGSVNIGYSGKYTGSDKKAFYISLINIPQESCIDLLSRDWGSDGLIALGYGDGFVSDALYGCSNANSSYLSCANDGVMTVNKAISICSAYAESGYQIMWKFY